MSYTLVIERAAQKSLSKISPPHRDRIIRAIELGETIFALEVKAGRM